MKHLILRPRRAAKASGYTLVELLIGLVVGTILTAMAVPFVTTLQNQYRLQGAVSSATWAIQSTRYQALMAGYPYPSRPEEINRYVSDPEHATGRHHLREHWAPPYRFPVRAFSLNQDTTLQFQPNGAITATNGALNFTLSYNGNTKSITVSNYGNITITP